MEEDEDAKIVFGIQKRMCRCCLNSSEQSMVYAPSVREAFLELAGITVKASDGLPQWICSQCLALLRKAVRFRRRILHADTVLRDYLRRCAPFPIDERDPELSKYATQPLCQTQILQFNTDKTKNGYHSVLQHVKSISPVMDVSCKMEYEEPMVKLENQYSDIEDDLPLMELRSNREDSVLEDDGIADTISEPVKRKKESKSRKRKKKKYENECESNSDSEYQEETYNISILEPLESTDPLESNEQTPNLDETEISDENFKKKLKRRNQLMYLKTYKQFLRWKQEKNISAFTENVFLTYFNELELRNKPPTLVNIYSMLKTTVLVKNGVNLGNFNKLKRFLKDRSKGYCVKPSEVFSKEDIDRFLKTAPDKRFLTTKVALIIGVCGGCLTSELAKLTVNDLELHENLILVKVKDRNKRERQFLISENYSEYVKRYMNLRPKYEIDRFLVHYINGNFVRIPMAKCKISAIPKNVATFLDLPNPEKYTGHGFRKTFQALFDTKTGFSNDSSESSRKNDNVANSYDGTANSIDNMANSSNTTANNNVANSYDGTANSIDNMANSINTTANNEINDNYRTKFTCKTSSGKVIKLPEKSGKSYIRSYELFAQWMEEKKITNITEKIMLEYFKHLAKQFRPSSLWNFFSLLRKTILTQNSVDIKRFERLKQFLKSNIVGFEKISSKVFTESEIDMFLNSAPDYNYLAAKVVLLLGVYGACTVQEMMNLTTDNVKQHKNSIIFRIKIGNNKLRRFTIPGQYCQHVKRYMDLRPKNLDHNRFFFRINNSNYTTQVIGKNKIRLMPREVASFLVLPNPEDYNGYCFKRTSVALFGTICTIDSESESDNHNDNDNHNESDNQSDNHNESDNQNDNHNESDNHNENDNHNKQTENEPIIKIKTIKPDNFENQSDNFQQSRNIQTEFEELIKPQNIKQETVENTKVQENCTKIQENCTKIQENCTKIQENNTDSFANVPENSRKRYINTFKFLQTWMIENDYDSYSETVLLSYFEDLSKNFRPTSLCAKYSMLRVVIKLRYGIEISNYMGLRNFIKNKLSGYHCKKSRAFTMKEIDQFLNEAPDFKYLHWKVALIIGISGACQCKELIQLSMENVKIRGKIIIVKIISENKERKFFIKEKYVDIVKKYMELRPNVVMDRDENKDSINNLEEVNKRSSVRKRLELDPEKIRVITLNPEEQIRQREEETKKIANFMYHCKLCFKGFNFESKLENHMKKHSPSRGQYLCTVCQMYLPTMYSYRVHMLIHTHRYECVICERRMIDKQSILNHYRTQHEGVTTIIKCDICGKESSNDRTHRSHMRNHHSGTRPECDQCGKTFVNKDSLTEHILIHTGERKHACPICDKRCLSRAHVKHHMKAHSDVKEFYCVECDVRFKTATNLRVHLTKSLKHKDERSFKYPCSECPRRFESSSRLAGHKLVQHLGVRAHACSACSARLASRAGLAAHARAVHARRRPAPDHVCHTCGRAFRGKSILTNHMRTHTGEKPYACAVCARAFSQRTALRTHHRLVHLKIKHNNQKPQAPSLVEKTEQFLPKSEPQPTFDGWTRPCELYYPSS